LHVTTERDNETGRQQTLNAHIQFATNLGAHIVHLTGSSVATATAAFVKEQRITQAIFGRSALHGIKKYLYYLAIGKFMSEAPHVDLHIITQDAE
jgi:two-component system sensor histidine kinase KdpD